MDMPTVLLVDDTKLFLMLEKEMLSRSTAHVLTAADGIEALEIARQQRPDVIYSDLAMPRMDGELLCRSIRSDPELRGTPFIIVTTSDEPDDRARCLAAGCNGYLIKPFTRHQFLELGRRFVPGIERREQRRTWRGPVFFTIMGDTRTAISEDLSPNGMFVVTDYPVRVNDAVDVTFSINEAGTEWIESWGRVTWVNHPEIRRKLSMPSGFGVQFLAITDADRERLSIFLKTLNT